MKFTIAASAMLMATLTSARVINKAREAPAPNATSAVGAPVAAETYTPAVEDKPNRQAFELDVTTTNLGLKDYYSRDDGFIVVRIDQGDVLESATVRSVGDNVVCTIRDTNGWQVRKIGGDLSDTYEREEWEPVAGSVSCFFEGEEPTPAKAR